MYYTKEMIYRLIDQPDYVMKNMLPKAVAMTFLLICYHQYSVHERNFRKELKKKYLEIVKD